MIDDFPESPQEVVVEAVKRAAEKTNPALVKVLEVHLRETTGRGFEVVYEDVDAFLDSIKKLFGEYGGRFFELAIVSEIRQSVGFIRSSDSLREVLRELNISR
ncbi:NitrOD5 domain-containing protein [Geoglobus sp.]